TSSCVTVWVAVNASDSPVANVATVPTRLSSALSSVIVMLNIGNSPIFVIVMLYSTTSPTSLNATSLLVMVFIKLSSPITEQSIIDTTTSFLALSHTSGCCVT